MAFLRPWLFYSVLQLCWVLPTHAQNPAMNNNMAWQMQQQQMMNQQMMQLQHQMMMQMQRQQMQMAQQAMQRQMMQASASAEARAKAQQLWMAESAARNEAPDFAGLLPKPTREIWRLSTGQTDHLPSSDGSRLLVLNSEIDKLQCLNPESGKPQWELPLVAKHLEMSPQLMGDIVVYVTKDFELVIVNATNGKPLPAIQLGKFDRFILSAKQYHPRVLFPILEGGKLVIATYGKGPDGGAGGQISAVDAVAGKLLWQLPLPGGTDLNPIFFAGKVLVSGAGRVMALDLQDGKETWTFRMDSTDPVDGGSLFDGRLHVICGGRLYGVDARNGAKLWSVRYKGGVFLQGEGDRLIHTEVRGALFQKEWVVALDAKTGQKVWDLKVGDTRIPWIQNGKVFCNAEEELKTIDSASGKLLWSLRLSSYPKLPLIPTPEALYAVSSINGLSWIHAVDPKDGKVLWSHSVSEETSFGLLMVDDKGIVFPGKRGLLVSMR